MSYQRASMDKGVMQKAAALAAAGTIDVAFLLDGTSSMEPYKDARNSKMRSPFGLILAALESLAPPSF